jgi:hypothetical protein
VGSVSAVNADIADNAGNDMNTTNAANADIAGNDMNTANAANAVNGSRSDRLVGRGSRILHRVRGDKSPLMPIKWLHLSARRADPSALLTLPAREIDDSPRTTARRACRHNTSRNPMRRKPCDLLGLFGSLAPPIKESAIYPSRSHRSRR